MALHQTNGRNLIIIKQNCLLFYWLTYCHFLLAYFIFPVMDDLSMMQHVTTYRRYVYHWVHITANRSVTETVTEIMQFLSHQP